MNATGTTGETVTLVCNSSVARPANWWYKDQRDEVEIVVNGEVVNGNVHRITLVGYNLVIHNALPNDTGTYTCVEDTGFGQHHKIFLTVTGVLCYLGCISKQFDHLSVAGSSKCLMGLCTIST